MVKYLSPKSKIIILFLLSFLMSGCAQSKAWMDKLGLPQMMGGMGGGEEYVVYTVSRRNETLSSISAKYTGNSGHWPTILNYNPGLNPNRIALGTKVKIPTSMIDLSGRAGSEYPNSYPVYTGNRTKNSGSTLASANSGRSAPRAKKAPPIALKPQTDELTGAGELEAETPISNKPAVVANPSPAENVPAQRKSPASNDELLE